MKSLIAGLVLLPSVVLAHPGDHGFVSADHLVTEPDHLAMIGLGVAVVIALVLRRWARS